MAILQNLWNLAPTVAERFEAKHDSFKLLTMRLLNEPLL